MALFLVLSSLLLSLSLPVSCVRPSNLDGKVSSDNVFEAKTGGKWRKIELCPKVQAPASDAVGANLGRANMSQQVADQANNVMNCAVAGQEGTAAEVCGRVGEVASPILTGAGGAISAANIAYIQCSKNQVKKDLDALDALLAGDADAGAVKAQAAKVSTCVFEDAAVGTALVGFFGGSACAAGCVGLAVGAALTGPVGIGLGAASLAVGVWQASALTAECNKLIAKLNEEIVALETKSPGTFPGGLVVKQST